MDYLAVWIVPSEANANDEEGYQELAKKSMGIYIPNKDKVLIEQMLKEFSINTFPQIYIFDHCGDSVSDNGINDILELDFDKIKRKWTRDMHDDGSEEDN